ncbi:MAG: TolC family protein, partial [Planctomycetota bacterium]
LALENGTGPQQELAQATGQYFQFRGQLESNLAGSNLPGSDRRGVYGAERELRFLMGLSPTDGRLIRPVDEPTIARVENQWEESVCQSLYLNAEIRQNRIRLKQLENELILAKNQVLPEVNVSLLYRWVGVGDTLGPPQRRDQRFPAEGSSALGELTGGDYQEGAIRLEITPPALGMRRELARVNGARLRLRQAKEFIRESERALVLKLSDAFAKTDAHYKLVQTNAQQWQAAEAEVEARLAEFKVGRSPVNVVLQSQQRRAQAQEGYYRALGEYNKSINYIDYLKGTLLANSGINIAEGPWNKKAYWDALERARERSAGRELQYGVSRPSVQRRGPLGNAQSAVGPNGTGVNSIGQTLPPEGGEPTLADPMGAGLEPLSEVPDVPERSLGEATGESMQEFLDEPTVVDPAPVPVPESAPPAVPIPDVAPNSGAQFETMNYQQPQSGYAPTPVRRKPLPHP